MATISFRVSDELKKKIDSYEEINWSAVFRKAVNDKLKEEFLKEQILQGKKDLENGRVFTQKQVEELLRNVN